MDDLDRVFHRLVSNIRHRHSEYLTLPFTVQELYETLIPYRHHRRELGIETNQDYEIAMTRLLSGERDYLLADQSMRDKLKAEIVSIALVLGIGAWLLVIALADAAIALTVTGSGGAQRRIDPRTATPTP